MKKKGVGDEVGVYTCRPVQGSWHLIYGRWRVIWEFKQENDMVDGHFNSITPATGFRIDWRGQGRCRRLMGEWGRGVVAITQNRADGSGPGW